MDKEHEFSTWPGNFKYSPLCQAQILYCGQLGVYQEASEILERLSSIEVSDSSIQRMCTYYGDQLGEDLYDAESRRAAIESVSDGYLSDRYVPEDAQETQEDVLYLQFDGGFIFSDDDWTEVKLGRVFHQSDCQVVAPEDRGNRITRSEYAASLGHYSTFTEKFSVLIQEAYCPEVPTVFITDGAIWMRNWMNESYPEATQILDFFHACEHLGEFAKEVVGQVRKNHRKWYRCQKEALKQGKILAVIQRIKQLGLKTKSARVKRKKLLKYFEENAYRMEYDQYRAAGYMIGSGPIEAAHRTVVQKRMKLSGQRWSHKGAQPMLNLRVAFKSDREIMLHQLIRKVA